MTFLLDCAIKVSAILLTALAATFVLRGRSAAVRHSILCVAILCSAITPLVSLVMPAWNLTVLSPPSPAPVVQTGETTATSVDTSAAIALPLAPARPAIPAQAPEGVWLAGVAIGILALIVGSVRLARVTAFSELLEEGTWPRLSGLISKRYGLRWRVKLLQSRNASILVTWGVLRPAVLLPTSAGEWPEERIRVVLSHELAHVRRYDWLVQMTAELLRAVYWFNPLTWVACSRLRQESEYACDDAAIAEGIDGTEYAAHLLDLARALNTPNRAWSAALAMARPSTVERRFTAMLNPAQDRRPVTRIAILAIVIAALGITLPLGSLHSTAQAQTQLAPTTGRLIGTVTDANGVAVTNATVIVSTADGRTEGTTTTSASGAYTVAGLAPGIHIIQVFASGFGPSRLTDLELKDGQNLRQDVKMDIGFVKNTVRPTLPAVTPTGRPAAPETRPGGNAASDTADGSYSIRGIVRDPSGALVPGVEVTVSSPALTNGVRKLVTDEQGGYGFRLLPAGTYRVTVSLPGFKTLNMDNIIVVEGRTASLVSSLAVATSAQEITVTPTSSTDSRVSPSGGMRGTVTGFVSGAMEGSLRGGGNVQQPMLLEQARPAYPSDAVAAQVQGVVIMEGIIGKAGNVLSIRVIAGPPVLQQAAIDAVSKWHYTPALLNGEPIETTTTITVNFSLNR